jgi:hypothetical protein
MLWKHTRPSPVVRCFPLVAQFRRYCAIYCRSVTHVPEPSTRLGSPESTNDTKGALEDEAEKHVERS